MVDVKLLLVDDRASIRDALDQLQRTGAEILLLVDESGRLVRTVTDGDLRRLLLADCGISSTLSALPTQAPIVAGEGVGEVEGLEIMNRRQIDQLPLVDSESRPVSVLLRRDLSTKILLSTPHLGEYEMGFVEEAFRTNWVAPLGPNVDAFEQELSAYLGVEHAAALVSGTAALHLALHLLHVGPGDSVFCSSLTFVASANPILYVGATPVFIDSDPATWNMSPRALKRALVDAEKAKKLPKAVVVVNLYGQSADMDPLLALCDHYGVPVVEDAAESLGATYKGRHTGTLGRIGIFSFNGNKIITTSGGGMLVSSDGELVKRARFLSTQAREDSPWYEHSEVGFNYRMSNILAGIGRGQLKALESRVAARREVYRRYVEALEEIPVFEWMPEAPYGRSTHWLTACVVRGNPEGAGDLIRALGADRIEARHVWKPMHQQPLFVGCRYYPHDRKLSFSDAVFSSGVCLPSGSNMTAKQQDRIIRVIRSFFRST